MRVTMKYEITSNHTKKMLADSLRKFLVQKPFSKVTVSEIIRDCGVNRKTFYYHFADINELLAWCFEEDFSRMVQQFSALDDLKENIRFALNYIDANAYILNCIHDAAGLIELKKFLYKNCIPILLQHFSGIETDFEKNLDSRYKDFIYPFCSYAIVNLLLDQFNHLTPYHREELIDYIVETSNYILQSTFPDSTQETQDADGAL